jgi:hypothetical protein
MQHYQFESMVEQNGTIVVPREITQRLQHHRVQLTIVDLESIRPDPVKLLQEITHHYTQIVDEPDLDIAEIYHQREFTNDRDPLFT